MTTTVAIPPRLQEIIDEFQDSDRDDKLALLLEFSDRMPALPDWLNNHHEDMRHVPECMTPVYIYAQNESGKLHFLFDIPPESPTTRGYAALLAEGLDGLTPEQVLQVPSEFYQTMGLQKVLSPQRLNGITAILAHIKRLATKELGKTA